MKTFYSSSTLIVAAACVIAPALAFAHGGPKGAHFFEKFDANGDGKVTRTEARAVAKTHFSEMDANSDRVVTLDEAKKHAQERFEKHRPTPEEQKARFDEADKNKNGKLERSESRMPERWFDKADTNKDGALTPEELKAAFEAWKKGKGMEKAKAHHEKRLGHFFDKMDANDDGKVTWTEAQAVADARFDKMDANKDQAVTQEEARAHSDKMRDRHGKKGHGKGHGKAKGHHKGDAQSQGQK